MIERKLEQYFLTLTEAKKLKGKVIESIEREGDGVKICFADGTAISFSGDRPPYQRLMIYYWKTKNS